MSDRTNIEWSDASWNPIRGCSMVSKGCSRCYAQTVAHRFSGPGKPYEGLTTKGRWNGSIRVVEEHLLDPLKWRRPRRVFVNSMSDLFHENVSDATIDAVFAVMALSPRHTFQVLTKRPERMRDYMNGLARYPAGHCWADTLRGFRVFAMHGRKGEPLIEGVTLPLVNVWLGVSVEDQRTADRRISILRDTPAAVRFISAEPLLAEVDLERGGWALHRPVVSPSGRRSPGLDWIIVGGESGPGARPCDVSWIRRIVEDARGAGVPCFVKQDSGPRAGMQGRIPDDLWAFKEFPNGANG